ncbi:MAG TPA: protein translocase subunit SecF [Syntrophales bacterium]|nr:protein translocase subunit SecF [Syntrophales bacterium]
MELIKPGINVNFVAKMRMFFYFSMTLTLICILYLIVRGGPILGIDFAGGTVVQVKYSQATSIDKIRQALKPMGLEGSVIQEVGSRSDNEYLLRIEVSGADLKGLSDRIEDSMAAVYGKKGFEIRRVEAVGPKAGKDLTQKGILAVCFSLLGMLIYISWRYEFRFALGGIIALIHDVIVSVAVFTVLGGEFTLTIIAALLTIIGYSINDTVVVFDRIRENMRKNPSQELGAVINASINQTLSRTILTSFTVFLVLIALYFFGGVVIHDFAFILLIGVVFGTYSSVFIASPLVLVWESIFPSKRKRKK